MFKSASFELNTFEDPQKFKRSSRTCYEMFVKHVRKNDIDLILAVGASLGELGTGGWNEDLLNTKLVHIDSSVEHFTRSPMANHHVCGNLEEIFNRLVNNITEARKWGRQWTVSASEVTPNIFGGHFTLDEKEKCIENRSKPHHKYELKKTKSSDNIISYLDEQGRVVKQMMWSRSSATSPPKPTT